MPKFGVGGWFMVWGAPMMGVTKLGVPSCMVPTVGCTWFGGVAPAGAAPLTPPFAEGTEEPVTVRDVGDGVYECEYLPKVPGRYQVSITWGGYAIPRRSERPQHGDPPTHP